MLHMFSLAFDEDILHVLSRCEARLAVAPSEKQFVTGDQPVALFNADARPEYSNGRGGLADPDTVVTLPLTSSIAVMLHYGDGRRTSPRSITADEVDEINRRTITMTKARLFGASAGVSITNLLLRYGHCRGGS